MFKELEDDLAFISEWIQNLSPTWQVFAQAEQEE